MPFAARRDQLAGGGVEQEDRSGVAVEKLAHALHQRVEQLIEPEVGKPGIRERLESPKLLGMAGRVGVSGRHRAREKVQKPCLSETDRSVYC